MFPVVYVVRYPSVTDICRSRCIIDNSLYPFLQTSTSHTCDGNADDFGNHVVFSQEYSLAARDDERVRLFIFFGSIESLAHHI